MKWLQSLYFSNRFYSIMAGSIVFFILGHFFSFLFGFSLFVFFVLVGLLLVDLIMVFQVKKGISGNRMLPERLSNGDVNHIEIYLENHYRYRSNITIIDEIPFQFQKRNLQFKLLLSPGQARKIRYELTPKKRGIYSFGSVNVYIRLLIGMVIRRYRFSSEEEVPVYPSFMQMRRYELLAISRNLQDSGIKKIRRIGHQLEFEQIKEYVPGDDYRTINWKATARKAELMVNTFQDERSQQVYTIIDKGRVMKMPFANMTLLDYAINASLVIANIAIRKDDKAGLLTFENVPDTFLPASKRKGQMLKIMEALYRQSTGFKESDLSVVFQQTRYHIKTRSLLLLFTNFESIASLDRQLPYLQKLNKSHLLVCIFFKNTELFDILKQKPANLKEIYTHTIAEKFVHDKKLVVRELNKHGIQSILTAPENLTVNTINKYLELKARSLI